MTVVIFPGVSRLLGADAVKAHRYRSGMQPGDQPSEEVREELRRSLAGADNMAIRMQYVSETLALIISVEDWLAIDSWLGAGKVADSRSGEGAGQAFSEFRAVSTVVCMAAELAEAAADMAGKKRYYAVGALVRQLIECEYLLTLFGDDLEHARRWRESTPDEVRQEFTPARMRRLTGFADQEYWNHCATGGHPAPKGARLLEKLDPARQSWPYSAAELLIDLGLHLHRVWKAIDALLVKHHARYEQVRATQREQAEDAWSRWHEADPVVAALIEAWNAESLFLAVRNALLRRVAAERLDHGPALRPRHPVAQGRCQYRGERPVQPPQGRRRHPGHHLVPPLVYRASAGVYIRGWKRDDHGKERVVRRHSTGVLSDPFASMRRRCGAHG